MALAAGCASQADIYNLDDRLAALEQRTVRTDSTLKNYQSDISDQDLKLREQFASLYAGIEGLREDLQRLTGRVEEVEHVYREKGQQVESAFRTRENHLSAIDGDLTELRNRLARLEQYLNLEAPAPAKPRAGAPAVAAPATAPPAPADAPAPAAQLSESELYHRAKSAFDQGQHENALRDFKEYMNRFPQSQNADNAQFWIGEIYYRDQMYEQAILEYQKVIEQYPKGNKVQASMLKQGLAFHRLGDKANARLFLNELIGKYPQSPEASIAKQKLNSL